MAQGTIIKVWEDATSAYAEVTVAEARGTYAYIGSTLLLDAAGSAKSNAQIKSDLQAAVAAVRAIVQATTTAVAGITGTVTV